MPLCPDCLKNDGVMNIMIAQGEEEAVYKGKKRKYIILVCTMGCGSSIRVRKANQ